MLLALGTWTVYRLDSYVLEQQRAEPGAPRGCGDQSPPWMEEPCAKEMLAPGEGHLWPGAPVEVTAECLSVCSAKTPERLTLHADSPLGTEQLPSLRSSPVNC